MKHENRMIRGSNFVTTPARPRRNQTLRTLLKLPTSIAAVCALLASPSLSHGSLADWQNRVTSEGTAPSATLFTTVNGATPILTDVGALNGDRTFEFVVNSGPNGRSQALLGNRGANGNQGLKFEQWDNTEVYGLTVFGVIDLNSTTTPSFQANTHVVFVSDGTTGTDLYVNGSLAHTFSGHPLQLTGIQGLGAVTTTDPGFIDNLDGNILGFASYDSALSALEISDHFVALRPGAVAIPGSVTVTIQPTNAVADGAHWTLDGGSELPSGFQQQGVAPGRHMVRFGNLGPWREPQAIEVLVIGGKEAQVAATFTPVPAFDFQAVPEQHARHGETVEFFVRAENPAAQLQVTASPPPAGQIAFDAATGHFTYTPDEADRLPFSLTIANSNGQSATTTITPISHLPAEEIVIDYERSLPDDESRDYITISESKNAAEPFNDATNETLNVDISGKTLVFANDHPASLHRQYSDRENIKRFRLYADRVIIRTPLILPQTHVSIHARELRFEGDGLIDTTPKPRVKKPAPVAWEDNLTRGNPGDPGHKGGDVDVLVERFHADPTPAVRFILRGGNGGPAGEGRNGLAENTRNPDGTAFFPFLSANWHRLMARSGNPVCGSTLLSAVILHLEDRMQSPTEFCGSKVTAHGESAVPSGRPGEGGAGGTLRSTLDLTPFASFSGGSAGAKGADYVGAPRPTRKFVYRVVRPTLPDFEPRTTDTEAPKAAGANATAPEPAIPVGAIGRLELLPDSGAWLHSFAVRSVIQFAKDAYLNGHELEARSLLAEYRDLVRSLQPVLPDGAEPSGEVFTEKTSLDQLVLEMETLVHRIDSNLDFFGNPAGWVPMLSFEANLVAFQNEVDQSIPILYLAHWLTQAATNLQNSLAASEVAHGKLKIELDRDGCGLQ